MADAEIQSAFTQYLALVRDPGQRARLYDCYAAEAPLLWKRRVLARRDLPREEFVAAPDAVPGSADEVAIAPLDQAVLEDWQPLPAGDRGVAWFRARTPEREVWLAAGLIREDGAWKIGWATVAKARADWSYALGQTHTVGEFALGLAGQRPPSWLDLAYHRHYTLPRPKLNTLPGARFACQGTGTCCKARFEVLLPPAAQAVLDAIPWETIHPPLAGQKLPENDMQVLILKGSNDACRYLDDNGHCRIHALLGRQPFSACSLFPFHFAETPDGYAVTTSHVCSTVRGGFGPDVLERSDDLYERAAMAHQSMPDHFTLGEDKQVPWEVFRDTEALMLELLARTDLPLYRRLWLCTRLLDQRLDDGDLSLNPAWETQELEPLTPEGREGLQGLLLPLLVNTDRPVFRDFAGKPYPEVFHQPLADMEGLAKLLQNVIYIKSYSYAPHSLTHALNVAILIYLQVLNVLELGELERLTPALWDDIALLALHAPIFHALAPGLLRTPGFGRWILRYPSALRPAVTPA